MLDNAITNRCLIYLEDKTLNATNRPLNQLGLPTPDRTLLNQEQNHLIRREMSYDREELAELIESRDDNLTPEQRVVLEAVMGQINQGGNNFFFLDAPGKITVF